MLGSYSWNEDLVPRDEFNIRHTKMRKLLEENGWHSAFVYGDAREHGWLAWLTNYIPRMRWALALFSLDRDPLLLVSMSSRDVPAMRRMTWLTDVRTGWEWKWFDSWVESANAGRSATIGFDFMSAVLFNSIRKSVSDKLVLENADRAFAPLRNIHRPREIALIKKSASICSAAAERMLEAYDGGADVERATLAGERLARGMAAQDVRTLVSRNGGLTLEPFRGKFDDRPKQLLAYIGVKYLGYWSEAFVSSKSLPWHYAKRSLDAMILEAKVGIPLARLAEKGRLALGEEQMHPIINGDFGARIGLSSDEGERIATGTADCLRPNIAYSLHTGCLMQTHGGAILSATIIAKIDGTIETLMSSPGA